MKNQRNRSWRLRAWSLVALMYLASTLPSLPAVEGWLHWRGPHQNGTSDETGLPEQIELNGRNHLWTYDLPGRGEAVIADGRVYAWGYRGEGPDLQEVLVCLDAATGRELWSLGFNDFLSDIVYNRYSIGAPTVDAETGNIYLMTSPGEMVCVSPQGNVLWRHSMMERFGLLTFPNGRRGAAVIDGDLVIHHAITSYWGADGPARDRFFAFEKRTGQLVWSSTPGTPPKDSSFSSPVLSWAGRQRVLYCGTGCGNVVAINARTGKPLWRFHLSTGGVNSSVLLHGQDRIIAIHGKENLDSSEVGRMVAIRLPESLNPAPDAPQRVLGKDHELWRNPLSMFTSSPVLVGDRVYQVTHVGDLACVDARTGKVLWQHKLSNGQLHASPLAADGKLYVPMADGKFFILRPKDDGVDVLDTVQLEGGCLGAPTVWQGRLYVHSMKKLYCFGSKQGNGFHQPWPDYARPEPGSAAALQIVPSDVLLKPGATARFNVRKLDAAGWLIEQGIKPKWEKFIPPTAKVKAKLDADFNAQGELVAAPTAHISAGAFRATADGLTGILRGRLLPALPFEENFESFQITEHYPEGHIEAGTAFAYPPLPWIGARFKWDIREVDGNKMLVKTLDNVLFQRAQTFIGPPDLSNYTIEADVRSDGNRRMMSNVGVINQRYVIALIGNWQQLEVSSNHDRIKVGVPFRWQRGVWYRLKARVDVAEDGSGVVRAKAWRTGAPEPEGWLIEVPHRHAHRQGAPGLFGFALQSQFKVYVDNIRVYPNQP